MEQLNRRQPETSDAELQTAEPFPIGAQIVLDFRDGYIDRRVFTVQSYENNMVDVTFCGTDGDPIGTHIWLEPCIKFGRCVDEQS